MEFRVLGPLEVVECERSLSLGGLKQRSLLAALLLQADQLVSADHLIGELWGDAAPATAAKSIQVYVSRLRKGLGAARVATRAPGYVLRVEPFELDLARLERLLGEARTADPRRAAAKLGEALSLWCGPALAGVEVLRSLALPLAGSDRARELIVACVVGVADVGAATAALADRADEPRARGVAVRTAAFSSPTPGEDVVGLAAQQRVGLVRLDAGRAPKEGQAGGVLERAPCDVALLVEVRRGPAPGGLAPDDMRTRFSWSLTPSAR